jgi:hypothetical protein
MPGRQAEQSEFAMIQPSKRAQDEPQLNDDFNRVPDFPQNYLTCNPQQFMMNSVNPYGGEKGDEVRQ